MQSESVRLLFDKRHNIESIFTEFSNRLLFDNFLHPFFDLISPISYLCSCTCEGLLGRSHFFSTTLLQMLVCLNRLDFFRIGNGHKITEIVDSFKSSDLADEPLYVIKDVDPDVNKERLNSEMQALHATEEIINLYANRGHQNNFLHPHKVYWYLVHRLQVDLKVASKHHSPQGLIRLIINFLLIYKDVDLADYPNAKMILYYYESIEKDIKELNPKVLPLGADFEIGEVAKVIKLFSNIYQSEYSKSKKIKEKRKMFVNYTIFASLVLRASGEYQNPVIKRDPHDIFVCFNSTIDNMYVDLENDEVAEYHYYERWHKKISIARRYKMFDSLRRTGDQLKIA